MPESCRDSNLRYALKTKVAVEFCSNNCQDRWRFQRSQNAAVRHGNDSGALELSRDIFPAARGKPAARSGQRILTGCGTRARRDSMSKASRPAEETENRVLGPDLLRTGGQCPHHFFIEARGVSQGANFVSHPLINGARER